MFRHREREEHPMGRHLLSPSKDPGPSVPDVPGTIEEATLPLLYVTILTPMFLWTLITTPAGRLNWLLETGPGLFGIAILAATFHRFPMTRWVYTGVFVHILVITYGGYYTYEKNPLGYWIRDTFHLSRNPYDRVGHFAQGFFPAFVIREILLRRTPLRTGEWLNIITVAVALAQSAFYEILEWWAALLLDEEGSDKFLGTQGDIWDTQWDMLTCLFGAMVAVTFWSHAHNCSIQQLVHRAHTRV